jgi:hypothetical protein
MTIRTAYRAPNERQREGEGTMPRRIVRTIFGAAAAGAVIAALVLTTAGAAHGATGRQLQHLPARRPLIRLLTITKYGR